MRRSSLNTVRNAKQQTVTKLLSRCHGTAEVFHLWGEKNNTARKTMTRKVWCPISRWLIVEFDFSSLELGAKRIGRLVVSLNVRIISSPRINYWSSDSIFYHYTNFESILVSFRLSFCIDQIRMNLHTLEKMAFSKRQRQNDTFRKFL